MVINQQTKGSIMPDSLKLVIAGMRRNELHKTDPQMCREIVAMCACVHILHVCVLPSAVLPWQCPSSEGLWMWSRESQGSSYVWAARTVSKHWAAWGVVGEGRREVGGGEGRGVEGSGGEGREGRGVEGRGREGRVGWQGKRTG